MIGSVLHNFHNTEKVTFLSRAALVLMQRKGGVRPSTSCHEHKPSNFINNIFIDHGLFDSCFFVLTHDFHARGSAAIFLCSLHPSKTNGYLSRSLPMDEPDKSAVSTYLCENCLVEPWSEEWIRDILDTHEEGYYSFEYQPQLRDGADQLCWW